MNDKNQIKMQTKIPDKILVRGAKVHNLKNIDVDIPLNKIVGIAGVSGSGKSSLALGVLYAEGSRRYLESLSTYTRRRMTQASKADVDEVKYVPASLALHQRPAVPNIRSTFGTGTELLNSLRLMFSRLASHMCPNGHYVEPSLNVAAEKELICPKCKVSFYPPSAEELAFNSSGACPKCDGVGTIRTVDESTLVPDETLTIDEGAVLPWQTLMWSLMKDIARELGVRTDVPFNKLTKKEREIVFRGAPKKHHMIYQNQTNGASGEMDFTYFNAIYTVENALSKVKDEKGMKRVEKFLKESVCDECHGTRLSKKARSPKLRGITLDEVCKMTLVDALDWVKGVSQSLPKEMRPMANAICESFFDVAKRLLDLGLGYLTLDRASCTLSTGERQRMELARAVRNMTTGVMYVLDEPSIGLHPHNIKGLNSVIHDLVKDGNTVILVDHDTQILKEANWLIELGPSSGANGGKIINEGTISDTIKNPKSKIAPFLSKKENLIVRPKLKEDIFKKGEIFLSTKKIHTVKPLKVKFPKGKFTVVTGVSGSGKTTLILESLIPALSSKLEGKKLPSHINEIRADGIKQIKLIDATPIGINVRSTVATYANVHDELRKVFAKTNDAKTLGYKAGEFSYNTGNLRCKECDGTGSISLDVQFLPDVDIECPSCKGARYSKEALKINYITKENKIYTLPQIMAMDINNALIALNEINSVKQRLKVLNDLGLGYLTLGEATPNLSGGEAQRLKLATEMGRKQEDTIFVFDEPTIGLHPLDVKSLLNVFEKLISNGATLIVIEHDLDVIRNADYIIDMGPEGGDNGGEIVFEGEPSKICKCKKSYTGRYL